MPNRFLKESICTSDTIDALGVEEERFFYRLIVNCDDFGRTDARPKILRARLFPLRVDSISEQTVAKWVEALARVGLLSVYIVQDRPYLHVTNWEKHQQGRAKSSKWPAPSEGTLVEPDYICSHLIADDSKGEQIRSYPDPYPVSGSEIRDPSSAPAKNAVTEKRPADAGLAEPATDAPKKARRGKHDGASHRAMFSAIVDAYGLDSEQISTTERGMVNRVTSDLLESGLKPEDVPRLRSEIAKAFPNLGTIPPTMLPKYVYLLKQPAVTGAPKAPARLVDEPTPNGSTNYVAMIQARQKGQNGVRQDETPGDGDDNRGPPVAG